MEGASRFSGAGERQTPSLLPSCPRGPLQPSNPPPRTQLLSRPPPSLRSAPSFSLSSQPGREPETFLHSPRALRLGGRRGGAAATPLGEGPYPGVSMVVGITCHRRAAPAPPPPPPSLAGLSPLPSSRPFQHPPRQPRQTSTRRPALCLAPIGGDWPPGRAHWPPAAIKRANGGASGGCQGYRCCEEAGGVEGSLLGCVCLRQSAGRVNFGWGEPLAILVETNSEPRFIPVRMPQK